MAERAGHHDGFSAGGQGLLDDLAAELPLDLHLGHAHGGAAALGLVVPPLDVHAGGLEQQVHHHGLLDVVLAGEFARAAQQAAVVGDHFELGEVGLDQARDLLLAHELHEVLGQRPDGHPAGVGLVEHLVDFGPEGVARVDLDFGVLLPLIAGGAGSQQLVGHRGGLPQVAGGEGLGQQMVHHVRRGGAAAGPVGHLFDLDPDDVQHLADGDVVLGRGLVQRAAGVVSEGHSATPPSPPVPQTAQGSAPWPWPAAPAAPAAFAACARAASSRAATSVKAFSRALALAMDFL